MSGDVSVGVLLLLVVAALLAGWVDAVVGGGGLIQLPSLLIGLPSETPVPTVSGTNKISSVFGTGVAALTYARRVRLDATTALALVASAGVGLYDGLIGPGTGTFFVIALVALLGYEFLEATALTKLATLTTNVAAIAVLGSHGHILWGVGLIMAAANLTGGFLGAHMAVRHGNRFVRRVFLVVLAALSLKLALDSVFMVF